MIFHGFACYFAAVELAAAADDGVAAVNLLVFAVDFVDDVAAYSDCQSIVATAVDTVD